MKISATILFMLCTGYLLVVRPSYGQTTTVTGWVTDETQQPLMAATAVLLKPSDSVMVSFGITNEAGNFTMTKVAPGPYILQMAFMGFQDISQQVTIPEGTDTYDMGLFVMKEKTAELGEVVVTADHIPLLIKGDTIDYNARAFQTDNNAVVEDLLRKLPGVEVDANGAIRAQGESVTQVLVDGKEFFGNDATIATRNLPADAIERVQVYDKGSEAAEFTGVDDGTRIKTIDLRLKEDKKNGVFGKVGGGYGTEDVFAANATLNRFGGGTQLSFLGAANNRNLPAFSMGDYIGFSGGMQSMSGGGGMMVLDVPGLGNQDQTGVTTSYAGGLNFNHEFSPNFDLRSSYFYNASRNLLEGNMLRQSLLTDNAFSTEETTTRTRGQDNHRGNVRMIWERPEQSSLILSANGGFTSGQGDSETTSETMSAKNVVQNRQSLSNASDSRNHTMDVRATYRQLFAKPGRLLMLQGNGSVNTTASDLSLFSRAEFALDTLGQTYATQVIDQRQAEDQQVLSYQAQVAYTEPLGRGRFLETAYERTTSVEDYGKDFFDREGTSEVLNATLSNAFTKRFTTDVVGVSLRLNRDDFGMTSGVDFQASQLSANVASDLPIENRFMNILPRVSGEYEFTTSKSINFNYQTSLNEPSLRQLQPVLDNSNPLVTVTGNPNLIPEYNHSLRLGYHSFSQLRFRSLFAMASASYTRNKITNTQTIDEQFRQVIRPENTGDAWTATGYVSGSFLIKAIKTSVRINGSYNFAQQQQWVNAVENQTRRNNGQVSLSFDNKKKEVLDWTLGVRYGLTEVQYSELNSLNQQYSNMTYYTIVKVPIGARLKVNTTFDYQQYFGEQFGGTQTVPLWNASVSRTFGPMERLELKLTAFDILNQNVGISRSANLNFIEDQQYNALSRYFLLTATWSLNQFGRQTGFIKFGNESIL